MAVSTRWQPTSSTVDSNLQLKMAFYSSTQHVH